MPITTLISPERKREHYRNLYCYFVYSDKSENDIDTFIIESLENTMHFKISEDKKIVFDYCSGSFLINKTIFNSHLFGCDLPVLNIIETFRADNGEIRRITYGRCTINSITDNCNDAGKILVNFSTDTMPQSIIY